MELYYGNDNTLYVAYVSLHFTHINSLKSFLNAEYLLSGNSKIYIGPKINIRTAWCSNVISILKNIGLGGIYRIEKFRKCESIPADYDKMTEEIYLTEPSLIENNSHPEIKIITDIPDYCVKLGVEDISRYFPTGNGTDVEIYDLIQSNSEHSRHWFFRETGLFDIIMEPWRCNPNNSLLAFADNSSAIRGLVKITQLIPSYPTSASQYNIKKRLLHPTLTAETHNFPTAICPFEGAATGTGGRIRDNQCVGRGGQVMASVVGYCIGKTRKIYHSPTKILIDASNGASDYGNKFGEPLIGGFVREYGDNEIEWVKPIMFTAGIGQVLDENIEKLPPEKGQLIVRIGGPAYKIGLGGGMASSSDKIIDYSAVQRSDPEMGNRMNRVVQSISNLIKNPIIQIHDQGAGGMGNVTKEIVNPLGAIINLDNVILGDKTMSALEIWSSEHQEQNTMLITSENLNFISKIAERENCPLAVVGTVSDDGIILVNHQNKTVFNMKLENIFQNEKRGIIIRETRLVKQETPIINKSLFELISMVFNNAAVCSKSFLVNKVDRSVGGIVAQQQTVGWCQLPLSDYQLVAQSIYDDIGIVTAIGERPILSHLSPEIMVDTCIAEMLTNMMFCSVTAFEDIKCQGNWMWSIKHDNQMIIRAGKQLSDSLIELGLAIDGGKDSLSMSANGIESPRTLVLTGYCTCPNIRHRITPDFKEIGNYIILIPLFKKNSLDGSILAQEISKLGNNPPIPDLVKIKNIFQWVQNNMTNIISGHDISDGGLITTVLEMCFPNGIGCKVKLPWYFEEGSGIVLEMNYIPTDIEVIVLGRTGGNMIHIGTFYEPVTKIRNIWMNRSYKYEFHQTRKGCVYSEYEGLKSRLRPLLDNITIYPHNMLKHPKMAVIRTNGTNGERELAAAFNMAGFTVWDVTMDDLKKNKILSQFRCIAYAGGFSYGDVLGSGYGWYYMLNNEHIRSQIIEFYSRTDTISIGICNGAQFMLRAMFDSKLEPNKSGKFESRYVNVRIRENNNIFLQGLTNMKLGIWVAHGEGLFPSNDGCIVYVDDNGNDTKEYPYSPNGGIVAAIGTQRHLAMMPHPERSFLDWQIPTPQKFNGHFTGWFRLFQNAYKFVS